jgi:hypothetical protein
MNDRIYYSREAAIQAQRERDQERVTLAILVLALGMGLGAALALLFAPKTHSDDFLHQLARQADRVREEVQERLR